MGKKKHSWVNKVMRQRETGDLSKSVYNPRSPVLSCTSQKAHLAVCYDTHGSSCCHFSMPQKLGKPSKTTRSAGECAILKIPTAIPFPVSESQVISIYNSKENHVELDFLEILELALRSPPRSAMQDPSSLYQNNSYLKGRDSLFWSQVRLTMAREHTFKSLKIPCSNMKAA